ncbi:hypothetical protein DW917_14100 [Prevotella sp. AM42-24]|nr:hypothetical protein DW917_14100 [Prevotella sp. AM42-24]
MLLDKYLSISLRLYDYTVAKILIINEICNYFMLTLLKDRVINGYFMTKDRVMKRCFMTKDRVIKGCFMTKDRVIKGRFMTKDRVIKGYL